MTRVVINAQMLFGQIDISKIEFNPKSRDDIPQVLRGLQHIYNDIETREKIFQLLQDEIAPKTNKKNGRPGMELWKILVLGCLRVNLNLDYDKLQELANEHKTIRLMLGHPEQHYFKEPYCYEMQTLKDNIQLLTPELLDKVNKIVVESGYKLIKKKASDQGVLHGRCDSFVVETNVKYPTDINLLLDAMRTVISLTAKLCDNHDVSDFRQSKYNIRQVKQFMRRVQNTKRAKLKDETKKAAQVIEIKQAHSEYIELSQQHLFKVTTTLHKLVELGLTAQEVVIVQKIREFIDHGQRQINQIHRRVILGEIIPHEEKVFSLFKPYTEWVSKGKAGVPVELGVKVCIMEDQHQFIIHHMVMEKQTDDHVAVKMVKETKEKFPQLASVSMDKGFHSPNNQTALPSILESVVLPRKGKLSKVAKSAESTDEFRKARRQHSAVESAINALEVHGLNCCPDYGIDSFKRYVSLAVLARNIQRIGVISRDKERKIVMKKRRLIDARIQKLAA